MDSATEVARWVGQLRIELEHAGQTPAELSRRLGRSAAFAAHLLAGRRQLTLETAFRWLGVLRVSPGVFCDRLYALPGWRMNLGGRPERPLLPDIEDPVEGEPTFEELWQEALDAESTRIVDIAVELEALRQLLEHRLRAHREDEATVEKRADLKAKTLQRYLQGSADLALADLFAVLGALGLEPATFFGDLFPVPGYRRERLAMVTPSWTDILALTDRLLAGVSETSEQPASTEPQALPSDPELPDRPAPR